MITGLFGPVVKSRFFATLLALHFLRSTSFYSQLLNFYIRFSANETWIA